jgi:GTP-binding protein
VPPSQGQRNANPGGRDRSFVTSRQNRVPAAAGIQGKPIPVTRKARPKSPSRPAHSAPYPYARKAPPALIDPTRNPLSNAEFTTAAHELRQLPEDAGAEVVFAGRSNAGKSSALNALSGRPQLARVSKTPGRTQQLVVFTIDEARRLVDLPGYGYAQVPHDLREHWRLVLDTYFQTRGSLRGLALAMDVRHPLTEFDRNMLAFAAGRILPTHVLLTKSDKLSRSQGLVVLRDVQAVLDELGLPGSVQLFSSVTKAGVDEARAKVCEWLDLLPEPETTAAT